MFDMRRRPVRPRNLLRAQEGNVAILFGLFIVPLMIAGGIAIDQARKAHAVQDLQELLDTAVLRGAAEFKDLSQPRRAIKQQAVREAESLFRASFEPLRDQHQLGRITIRQINLTDDTIIAFEAETKMRTSLLSVVKKELVVKVTSAARYLENTPRVCVLSLHPDEQVGDLSLSGTADIIAPDCAMHSNSDMVANGSSSAVTAYNCTLGATSGNNFTPPVITGCPIQPDPFFSRLKVFFEEAMADYPNRCPGGSSQWDDGVPDTWSGSIAPPPATISYGGQLAYVFCDGLTVNNGTDLNLLAGEVLISFGPVDVRAGGLLRGDLGSALVVMGPKGGLNVQAQGHVQINAPTTGPFAGIALAAQPASNGLPPVWDAADRINMGFTWQDLIDNGVDQVDIIGGGSVEVVGSLYFPDRHLRITGAGDIGMNSDYFAVVGMTVSMEGNGVLRVGPGADAPQYSMPELPPVASGGRAPIALIK